MSGLSDADLRVGDSCANAVREAFELSLRWMAILTDEDRSKRYGPFGTQNEAEFYAQQIAYGPDTKIEVVEMHDVRVHEQRMERWHQEMDEKRKYERALMASKGQEG